MTKCHGWHDAMARSLFAFPQVLRGEAISQDMAGIGWITWPYNCAVENRAGHNTLTLNKQYDITCTNICQLLTVGNYRQHSVFVKLTNSSKR